MNIADHNRAAWDRQVRLRNKWTLPVSPEAIRAARQDEWSILLTPTKPVPRAWFGEIKAARILCLAGGGGQQGPILAAAGASVTVLDNSPAQLAQDQSVAERESLSLDLQLGEMTNLSRFADGSFDLIFHPVANLYIPDIKPVWRECFRVLRPGGRVLAGFANPLLYLFEDSEQMRNELRVHYSIPYADATSRPPAEVKRLIEEGETLQFGHSLEDQIGGQLSAGFVINGFYEDILDHSPIDRYIATQIATLALKP